MSTAERIVLVFGAALGPSRWMNAKEVMPLLGGDATAWEEVEDALARLERSGHLTRSVVGGACLYRREPLGDDEAARILREDTLPILSMAATTKAATPVWKPNGGEPERLADMIGQKPALYQIRLNADWAMKSQRPAKPMLLSGPSGLGKTMVGGLVSHELGVPWIHVSTADAELADIKAALALASSGGVLFLDELHTAKTRIRNTLLFELDAPELPFTPIAATTNLGALKTDLVRRFRNVIEFDPYRLEEAEQITALRAASSGLNLEPSLYPLIARASRCNPAKIAALIDECVMLASRLGRAPTTHDFVEHLGRRGIDERGVDGIDRRLLFALTEHFEGTAGIQKLAAAIHVTPAQAVTHLHELAREGLVHAAGTAGWTITASGTNYLRPQDMPSGA